MACVVERLERHPARHRAITHHRHHCVLAARQVARLRHAQARGDGRAAVTGIEGVVLALGPAREARYATGLAQGAELLPAPRQQLVRVGLMPHIPDELIRRAVEHVMQRDGEFHRPQAGRQMPSGARHRRDHHLADFLRQSRQLLPAQLLQIGRAVDPVQQLVFALTHSSSPSSGSNGSNTGRPMRSTSC